MKSNTPRGFNADAAVKIALLLGFAAFFITAVSNGSVSLYVHPRTIPFLLFAAAVMIAIAALLVGELLKRSAKKANLLPLVFFIIPLVLAFSVPAAAFVPSDGPVGDISISGLSGFKNDAATVEKANVTPENTDEPADAGSQAAEDAILPADGTLIIDGDNYYDYLNEIYSDISKYEGRKIEVVGFVFKDSASFGENEFVPARLMMVCCAADMMPVGLLCRFEAAAELQADSWVKVTGTIGKMEYDGDTIPCIEAETVSPAEEPEDSYIYPY